MNPGIFLISDNEELIEMTEQTYESEKLLQTWLAQYPALLVGNQIDAEEPKRFLLIEQECGVPGRQAGADRWSIDHLFIDQDAIPTIVEVKRSSDTRIRREVVGQMLDYAANATEHWRVDHMRERFAANCQRSGIDATRKLKEFLGDNVDPEDFWEKANRNLQDRKLRLLFIADVIPRELQRIVEFLNEQMDHTEVLAIEIKQFVGQQGLRSLVPRVIGQTTKAQTVKGSQRRSITNEDDFFAHLLKRSPEAAQVDRRILDWAIEKGLPITGEALHSYQLSTMADPLLMATLENATHPKALANMVKHLAFTRCGELNVNGMVDAQIAMLQGELLAGGAVQC